MSAVHRDGLPKSALAFLHASSARARKLPSSCTRQLIERAVSAVHFRSQIFCVGLNEFPAGCKTGIVEVQCLNTRIIHDNCGDIVLLPGNTPTDIDSYEFTAHLVRASYVLVLVYLAYQWTAEIDWSIVDRIQKWLLHWLWTERVYDLSCASVALFNRDADDAPLSDLGVFSLEIWFCVSVEECIWMDEVFTSVRLGTGLRSTDLVPILLRLCRSLSIPWILELISRWLWSLGSPGSSSMRWTFKFWAATFWQYSKKGFWTPCILRWKLIMSLILPCSVRIISNSI